MTNRVMLALIALGLWANAAVSYVRPARAQNSNLDLAIEMSSVERKLDDVASLVGEVRDGTVEVLTETLKRRKCNVE